MNANTPLAFLMALAAASCGNPAEEPATEHPAPTGPIAGVGVVTRVEANAVTIEHQAIDALGWGAMTMRFAAAPDLLQDVAVGDQVAFTLESADNPRTLAALEKR
jgi:Cu(I)/Ag(I) efflux system protein CusF